MGALSRAITQTRALSTSAHDHAVRLKASGALSGMLAPVDGMSQLDRFSSQNKQRYNLFRGWIYSAVNALASEAASQPVNVGRMLGTGAPAKTKGFGHVLKKAPANIKAAKEELEVLVNHPLLEVLNRPNKLQHKWQFVYSFVANLCLTGWAFIVKDENENGETEFYSLPTNWIKAEHKDGVFTSFRVVNPRNPLAETKAEPLSPDQVGFAYLPNPSDPLAALAPAQAQMNAVRIDEHIQTSQERFFENGVFPSVVITMGSNPHPDVPGGIRPRLTANQRRQVYGAIKKVSGGIANYGNPAIIDGMIEKIERLSATQNEMGWEKSEGAVRTRILSAFGVHPFILGEAVAGSYAQAYVIQERFCKKINLFLALVGETMTEFVNGSVSAKKPNAPKLLVWWDEAEPKDPSMEKQIWEGARQREDVTQNEFRAFMGLPPDEDGVETIIDKQAVAAVVSVASQTNTGALEVPQSIAILEAMGIPGDVAKKIAGKGKKEPPPGQQPILPFGNQPPGQGNNPRPNAGEAVNQGAPGQGGQNAGNEPGAGGANPGTQPAGGGQPGGDQQSNTSTLERATVALEKAVAGLARDPEKLIASIMKGSEKLETASYPLYVHRPVENAQEILDWASENGFVNTLKAEDLHVTVLYSKTPVDTSVVPPKTDKVTIEGGDRKVEQLGDEGAVVLLIESSELADRNAEFLDAGGTSAYKGYKAHVTISYDEANHELAVEPYDGQIVLGPEVYQELELES